MLIGEIATRFARDIFDDIGHDSYHQKNEKEKERADHDHADCYPDNGDSRLQELRDRLLDRLAKSIDVIGVDRHNIPVLVGIEILDRELLHAGKELVPQRAKRILRDCRHNEGETIVGQNSQNTDYCQHHQEAEERPKILASTIQHGLDVLVHQGPNRGGNIDRREGGCHNEDSC